MARKEFVNSLPVVMVADEQQAAKVAPPVEAHESGDFRIGMWIGLLIGMLTGGLAGAVTMLLLAPQSGQRTRAKLRRQSHELREQMVDSMGDAMVQAGDKAHQISHDVRKQAEKLEHRGQAMLDGQMDNLSSMVEAGKDAVQSIRD
jgi:gas vesicle protein